VNTAPSLARNPDLTVASTYHREVAGSLERVWENVFDWEHLPWLHAGTFRSLELVAEGGWGWRARVGFVRGGEAELELVADRGAGCYVARTLAGIGAGTEIWTRLADRPNTGVAVAIEFCLPPLPDATRAALGRAYVELYGRLWDEDEGMIREREAALVRRQRAGAPGTLSSQVVSLGPESALRARLPFEFELAGRRFRVVEAGGELVAYAVECPHRLGPLAPCSGEDDTLVCPWHGYRFDRASGRERTGRRLRLADAPRLERDPRTGEITARAATATELAAAPFDPTYRPPQGPMTEA
jgi:nitrite reductase/ring-hydroxylating ferredoxin subunit